MKKDINLLDILSFFVRHLKTFILHFIPVTVAAVFISLALPKTYKSTVVFIPPGSSGSGISALIGDRFDLDAISGNKLSKRQYSTLLKSRQLREELIRKFDLIHVYKLGKNPAPMDMALRQLKQVITITEEAEGGLGISDIVSVELTVFDESPVRASEMANFLFRAMEARAIDLSTTEYRKMLEFLESQGRECDSILDVARRRLKEFQIANKIYDVPSQVNMVMQAIALNQAELLSLQKQKAFLGRHTTRESGELQEISEKIAILESKSAELENKMTTDVMPGLKMSLSLANNYVDLLKEVETYVQVKVLLRQQQEMAKIRSSVSYSTVGLVDAARPAEWKTKPKRAFVVLGIVAFYCFMLALFLFAKERYVSLQRNDPEKLAAIRDAFRSRRT